MTAVAAVDLGASSGRVMVGVVAGGRLDLHELHRFWNGPIALPDRLHWDALGLWREVLHGLSLAGRSHELTSGMTPPRRSSAYRPRGKRFAYICCGTWGLVGLELERPVLSDQSREANFTNE